MPSLQVAYVHFGEFCLLLGEDGVAAEFDGLRLAGFQFVGELLDLALREREERALLRRLQNDRRALLRVVDDGLLVRARGELCPGAHER